MESLTELPDSHNSSLPHPSVRKLTSRMDYVKAKKIILVKEGEEG